VCVPHRPRIIAEIGDRKLSNVVYSVFVIPSSIVKHEDTVSVTSLFLLYFLRDLYSVFFFPVCLSSRDVDVRLSTFRRPGDIWFSIFNNFCQLMIMIIVRSVCMISPCSSSDSGP